MIRTGCARRLWNGSIGVSAGSPGGPSYRRISPYLAIIRTADARGSIGGIRAARPAGLMSCLQESQSQLGQDVLAFLCTGGKRGGFFVEAGACDGIQDSNSWVLEKGFGWTGILCEPAEVWRDALKRNRACHVDFRALWSRSGVALSFTEPASPSYATISEYASGDFHAGLREHADEYSVTSVSLNDLLEQYGAPRFVDFLSLDTEGSEFEILSAVDFSSHEFGVICCEHNFSGTLEPIVSLLESHGYRYLSELAEVSGGDAWFVSTRLSNNSALWGTRDT